MTNPVRDSSSVMKFWVCLPCALLGAFIGYGVSYFFQPLIIRIIPLSEYYQNAPRFLWMNLPIQSDLSDGNSASEFGQTLTRSLSQQFFVIAVAGIVVGTAVGWWFGGRILRKT